MRDTPAWRGIFPIVVTPFKADLSLDEVGLRRVVRFCIEAGAHGLVGPANASEYATLSDAERHRWLDIVIGEASGQIPVIATVNSGHFIPARELAVYAQTLGAAGIMSMPPNIVRVGPSAVYAYFEALAAAVEVPIIVQNMKEPVGTPMSADLMARMCAELEHVEYIKEETVQSSMMMTAAIEAAGAHCRGVFGGQGGVYLMDEYNRGSCGNMPACQSIDVMVILWELLETGDLAAARKLYNKVLPLINYERQYGVPLYKELLYRRGVIDAPTMRAPGREVRDHERAELDAILEDVNPLFTM